MNNEPDNELSVNKIYDRNKQLLSDPLYAGVPSDAVIIFPCVRHEPDLQGYGLPSKQLPPYLQIFGYWGYRLELGKGGMARLIPGVKNPSISDHCDFWLYHNYDHCLQEARSWNIQEGERNRLQAILA